MDTLEIAISDNIDINFPLTKFIIPESSSPRLNRTKINNKLNEAARKKLVIVTAPAGFGKSTAISSWVSQFENENNISWITLDKNDQEVSSFWYYVICAINRNENLIHNEKIPYLSVEAIINLLINHFSSCDTDYYIIFDDFHNVDNVKIYKSLEYFLAYLPKKLHCIIISRSNPPLSVSKMIIDEEIDKLDTEDLRFSREEISVYLNKIMDMNLSEDEIESLEIKTEGWVSVIKAAALSLRGYPDKNTFIKNFSGSNTRNTFQYIIEEIINDQRTDIREFLLKTSILKDLNEPICNALTGFEHTREIMETLESSNLFITSLGDNKENYRYHSLLAEALLRLLHIEYSNQVSDLYLAASRWYEEKGFYQDAFDFSIQSQDHDNTLRLLEKYFASNHLYIFSAHRICDYFETIPYDLFNNKPRLCIHYALALAVAGRISLDEVELLEKGINLSDDVFETLRGKVFQVRAYKALKYENLADVIKYSELSLQTLPGYDISCVTLCLVLGYVYRSVGDMNKAEFYFSSALSISSRVNNACSDIVSESLILSNFYLTSIRYFKGYSNDFIVPLYQLLSENITHKNCMYFCLATAYYDSGDFEKAYLNIIRGLELCDTYNDIFYERIKGLVLLARIFLYTGRNDEAVSKLNEIDKLVKPDCGNMFVLLDLPEITGLLVSLGLIERAEAYIEKFDNVKCKEIEFILCESQAELLFAKRNYKKAVDKLEFIFRNMNLEVYPKRKIELLVLAAAAYAADGNETKALELLKSALETKCAERYTRTFIDRGKSINCLLRILISRAKEEDNSNWLVLANTLIKGSGKCNTGLKVKQTGESGQLSKREMEILRLLARGLSYNEIGNELYISLSTVKKHTGNIYYKLQAKNRMEAVNIANDKRLID